MVTGRFHKRSYVIVCLHCSLLSILVYAPTTHGFIKRVSEFILNVLGVYIENNSLNRETRR